MKRITIYGLEDPRNGVIRYVGQTEDVYVRFGQHIRDVRTNKHQMSPKEVWIRELRSLNLMVIMRTLETVDNESIANDREAYWIHHCNYLAVKQNVGFFNRHLPENKATTPVLLPLLDIDLDGERKQKQIKDQFEKARNAYLAGAVSARKLGEALGVGKDTANAILNQMKRQGWITRTSNDRQTGGFVQ